MAGGMVSYSTVHPHFDKVTGPNLSFYFQRFPLLHYYALHFFCLPPLGYVLFMHPFSFCSRL